MIGKQVSTVILRIFVFFFFFQAEDGIRDKLVTGVQTCALPISLGQRVRRVVRVPAAAPRARTRVSEYGDVPRLRPEGLRPRCGALPNQLLREEGDLAAGRRRKPRRGADR